jgi:hypothetical protein
VLADLVAARRPTVTSAMSDLARRGLIRQSGKVWVLHGEPPGELLRIADVQPGSLPPEPRPPRMNGKGDGERSG